MKMYEYRIIQLLINFFHKNLFLLSIWLSLDTHLKKYMFEQLNSMLQATISTYYCISYNFIPAVYN